jgi:hypothetical protein
LRCGTNFGDAACVEDKDAIGKASEESGIVRDKNHREAELLPERAKELQDFLLSGGVERRGGFIGNDEGRAAGGRLGDEDALALASAQFVRIRAGNAFGVFRKHRGEKVGGFFSQIASIQSFVGGQNIADLLAYLQRRMQGGGRFLRDKTDASTANFS